MRQRLKTFKRLKPSIENEILQMQSQRSQAQLHKEIFIRFEQFLNNQKLQRIKHAIASHIGRNTPINYFPQYNFSQQWQTHHKPIQAKLKDLPQSRNFYIEFILMIIMLSYSIMVWTLSYQLVFETSKIIKLRSIDIFTVIIIFLHVGLKLWMNAKILQQESLRTISIIQFIKHYGIDAFFVVYFIIRHWLMVPHQTQQGLFWSVIAVDLLCMWVFYKRAGKIYKSFRMKAITSVHKDVFNLLDLLATLLTVAHLFSMMLYLAGTVPNSSSSWIKVAEIQNSQPFIFYIYAFYFACTTMLTVGYGDISPTNVIEICTVLLIEIFGIAIFAYIINEMGQILSSMRKQSQTLQKDLSSLNKISKYYGLNDQLQIKARSYIIDNQKSVDDLLPQEEKQLLMKLNDQLRTEINQQNSLKIIKSSVFFICHWSKKLQFQTAKKLIKRLYSPNENLSQHPGRQCLYVIMRGAVNIYTNRFSGQKKSFKKLLKTIQIKNPQFVSNNVYGYTAVISNRTVKLNAVTRDFAIVYWIQKSDFLDTVVENQLDFQYFHEIKAKIQAYKLSQALQTPAILNIRQHYRPNILFLIKKYNSSRQKSRRIDYIRDQNRIKKRRMKLMLYDSLEQLQGEVQYTTKTSKLINTHQSQQIITSVMKITVQRPQQRRSIGFEQMQGKLYLHHLFQSGKQYENYFKKFNQSTILWQQENTNWAVWSKVMDKSSRRRENQQQILKNVKLIKLQRRQRNIYVNKSHNKSSSSQY